jgi:hypothetical protein
MSRVTLSDECAALIEHTPLTAHDLLRMQLEAAQHSFLAAEVKVRAAAAIRAFGAALPPA